MKDVQNYISRRGFISNEEKELMAEKLPKQALRFMMSETETLSREISSFLLDLKEETRDRITEELMRNDYFSEKIAPFWEKKRAAKPIPKSKQGFRDYGQSGWGLQIREAVLAAKIEGRNDFLMDACNFVAKRIEKLQTGNQEGLFTFLYDLPKELCLLTVKKIADKGEGNGLDPVLSDSLVAYLRQA